MYGPVDDNRVKEIRKKRKDPDRDRDRDRDRDEDRVICEEDTHGEGRDSQPGQQSRGNCPERPLTGCMPAPAPLLLIGSSSGLRPYPGPDPDPGSRTGAPLHV